MFITKSKYFYVYYFEDKAVFWNSLHMNTTVMCKELAEKILLGLKRKLTKEEFVKEVGFEVLQMLERNCYICFDEQKDIAQINKLKKDAIEIELQNLVMLSTNKCNFDCVYCQIEKNISEANKLKSMTQEVANSVLDYFYDNCSMDREKTITITGGEPLLNWEVVTNIIQKVRGKFSDETRIVLFTNGSLVTKDIAVFLKENNVQVLVSFDGTKEIFNSVRLTKDRTDGFTQALNGYKLLAQEGCNIGISAVGGVHNVKELDKLKKFFSSLKPSSVGFNISHMLIKKENPTYISSEEYAELLIELYEYLAGKDIYLENISRVIDSFVKKRPRLRECQAQGRGMTVAPDGTYGPCKSLLVSGVFARKLHTNIKISEQDIFKQWAKRSVVSCEKCKMCPALTICGGGCGYDSYVKNEGDFCKIDTDICLYSKKILEYLLYIVSQKSQVSESGFYELSSDTAETIFRWFVEKDNGLQKSVGHDE